MEIHKKLYSVSVVSATLILFLIFVSSAASAAITTSNVVGTEYQFEDWGQYPVIDLFGEKYVPLLEKNNQVWQSNVNKLAKLVLDSDDVYNIRIGELLDLGGGYAIEAKEVDIGGEKVWLEFTKDGEYVDDEIISVVDNGTNTWEVELDGIQGETEIVVLRVHVNQIFQDAVGRIAQIQGIWLIDYINATTLQIGDQFGDYTLTNIINGVNESDLGSLQWANYPVTAFSASPTTGEAPLTVTFTDKSTGVPSSWLWNFGDEVTSIDQNTTHTYSRAGIYTVNLTVSNENGADSKNITINVLKATPTITWNKPADIVYGTPLSSTQLNAITSLSGTFVYTPPLGTVLSEGQQTLNVVFTPTDTANYNTASKDVTINVLTPVQKIQQMTTTVQGLVTSHVLNKGQTNALIVKLNAATEFLNAGNTKAAIEELNDFINQVSAFKGKQLSSTEGQELIDAANSVINVLKPDQ